MVYLTFEEYASFDVRLNEVWEHIDNDVFLAEANKRKLNLMPMSKSKHIKKDFICDMFGVGYRTSNEELIRLMSNYINKF